MTGTTGQADDELRARLRAGDPASSLPPADPHRVARLLEDTMAEHTDTHDRTAPDARLDPVVTESRYDGLRRRGPLTWLVAAAAVLLIAGGGVFALVQRGDGPSDTPVASAPGSPTTTASTTVLGAPTARGTARCLPPSAATLARQQVALDAVVTDVSGDAVTLTPHRFYAGAATDRVVVRAPRAQLDALIGAVRFRQGQRYLVSASDGEVSVCGLSAPWSQQLADLYAQAFAG